MDKDLRFISSNCIIGTYMNVCTRKYDSEHGSFIKARHKQHIVKSLNVLKSSWWMYEILEEIFTFTSALLWEEILLF